MIKYLTEWERGDYHNLMNYIDYTADHIPDPEEEEEEKKIQRKAKMWKSFGMNTLFASIFITNLSHVTDILNYTWVFILCSFIQFVAFVVVFGKIDSVYEKISDSLKPIWRWYNQRPPSLKKPQVSGD